MNKPDNVPEIEKILGYHFFEPQHLIRALTHPAFAHEQIQKNTVCLDQEAYSTLGDAVIKTGLILFLMEKGLQTKGAITQAKETLEDNPNLVKVGRRLKIRKFILLGRGEKDLWRSGEEAILADTVEALIGAIFLDSDASFGVVKQVIGQWFEPDLKRVQKKKPVEKGMVMQIIHPTASSRREPPSQARRPSQRRLRR